MQQRVMNTPNIEILWNTETEEVLSYIDDMKQYMLDTVNPQSKAEGFSQYQVMEFSTLTDQIMLSDPSQPFDGKILDEKLETWKASISTKNPELIRSVSEFEPAEMVNKPLYHVYMKLSKMQLDIVSAELESSASS